MARNDDPANQHAAAFEAEVQAAIQASPWALTERQLVLVGKQLWTGGAPLDALGRKGDTLLVVEAKSFYTAPGGNPSSLANRQAVMRHGYVQLERAARVLATEKDLRFKRLLPPAPRKVWGALVSEVKVYGLGALGELGDGQLFVGSFNLGTFSTWLAS